MLNSIAEIQTVTQKTAERTWIGLHTGAKDKSRWLWVDGSRGSFTNWNVGEPSNMGCKEDCVEINNNILGKWSNLRCTLSRHYICETSGKLCNFLTRCF